MTDGEWEIIGPLLPGLCKAGRPRTTDMRDVLNAIFYIIQSGCQWHMLPKCFPPFTTVQRYFYKWRDCGLWTAINHLLMTDAREAMGREDITTYGIIDAQSVKTTESGRPRGFDAGKKVKGRKRQIITDTTGILVGTIVHEANIQDRDGAPSLLASIADRCPWLRHIFADLGYAGEKLAKALKDLGDWTMEIVKRPTDAKGFVLVPRRWVVERTIAWLNRNRRLAKDFEAMMETAAAFVMIASVKLLTRRLARMKCNQ